MIINQFVTAGIQPAAKGEDGSQRPKAVSSMPQ
jgi:hypothetical protein